VKLFGLHFCDIGSRQLDVNNDVPQGVNKVCLHDPVIARCTGLTTLISTVGHFISCVSLTFEDIIIGLMVYMLTLICRNINKKSYSNFYVNVTLFIMQDIVRPTGGSCDKRYSLQQIKFTF
jgi:predicted secreted protein